MDNTRNWKMKCLNNNGNKSIYTINKIYEVRDSQFITDDNKIFNLKSCNINNFEQFKSCSGSKWELVEDGIEDKYAEIEKYKNIK